MYDGLANDKKKKKPPQWKYFKEIFDEKNVQVNLKYKNMFKKKKNPTKWHSINSKT